MITQYRGRPHLSRTERIRSIGENPVWGNAEHKPHCRAILVQTPRIEGFSPPPPAPFSHLETRMPSGTVSICSDAKSTFPNPKNVWAVIKDRRTMVRDIQPIGDFTAATGKALQSLSLSGSKVSGPGSSAGVGKKEGGSREAGSAVPFQKTILELSLGSPTMPGGIIANPRKRTPQG